MRKVEREENIDTYSSFKKALKLLFKYDRKLFLKKTKKETLASRMAIYLTTFFGKEWFVDVAVDGADLLVWDRNENIALALFLSKDYISALGKEKARNFHETRNSALTLAFSLLSEKDYILIYRFETEFVDYMHLFFDAGFEEKVLKRCLIKDDKDEALLFKVRKRKEKTEEKND